MSETVRYADLQLGDIVRTFDGPYGDSTVYQIADGQVHMVRPYVHTADFIYTGGVITYLGQDKFSHPANADAVTLLRSGHPEEAWRLGSCQI